MARAVGIVSLMLFVASLLGAALGPHCVWPDAWKQRSILAQSDSGHRDDEHHDHHKPADNEQRQTCAAMELGGLLSGVPPLNPPIEPVGYAARVVDLLSTPFGEALPAMRAQPPPDRGGRFRDVYAITGRFQV